MGFLTIFNSGCFWKLHKEKISFINAIFKFMSPKIFSGYSIKNLYDLREIDTVVHFCSYTFK